ncbi:MAG TPA: response regulator [Rhodocyclaceae bacterium]|nr:response regulator [Rhodocyclaceae bacterium]
MPEQTSTDKAAFQRVLTRNLMLPLFVGVVSAAVFVGLIIYLLSVLDWVDHTQRVISKANELTTLTIDMETGIRGFLITGQEDFRRPYTLGKPQFVTALPALMELVQDNQPQVDRLRRIQALQAQWEDFSQQLIDARGKNQSYEDIIRQGRGKQLLDQIRKEFSDFLDVERVLLKERSDDARSATYVCIALYVIFILILSGIVAFSSRRQIFALSANYGNALSEQMKSTQVLEQQAWLRVGHARLAASLVGQLSLPALGRNALEFLAQYLDAVVGAFYVRNNAGQMERFATYGLEKNDYAKQIIDVNDGLVGQVAHDGKINHVRNLSGSYFKVTSALGASEPAEVVVASINNDGNINGVIELGMMHPVAERDLELLRMIAASLGASVEAAQYRQRLQDALEETRQLNEELQTQQEELRTANEELEEQSRALVESQTNMEHQQAELEQTNMQLSEQALILDRKNESLNHAQTELQQRAQELQRASRYKSEFLANMSHELRTPLNSSLILAKLLCDNKTGNLTEEQLKFANTIYSSGNDLLTLINDILDLSKVEAGKMELAPQLLPVSALTESLRMTFEPLAREKNLIFESHIHSDVPESIYTDRQRLEQILKNLLSNAIKFTGTGKVSLVVTPQAGDQVAFSIADSGIGIPAEQQEVIFEAFRQADGTINRRYGGTGLGLSISRELAGLLGGSIEVVSAAGQGSTFTLVLPVRWTESKPTPIIASASTTSPFAEASVLQSPASPLPATHTIPTFPDDRNDAASSKRVVLIVEDDAAFATILYDLAHEMHYRCLVAHGAAEGLQLAMQHVPSAILLDIRLPDESGLRILQQLKEYPRTRHIPVHIIAAEDFTEVAMHLGAVGFAIKPTTREELISMFKQLEERAARKIKKVLLVEDDERQRQSVVHLIGDDDIDISAVGRGEEALALLRTTVFDCMIIDLKLPDMDGSELLARMTHEEICSFPPVIVYTGRNLTREEEAELNRYSRSIIIKGARSPERLLDEVTLFLHKVESQLSTERRNMLQTVRNRDRIFEGRTVLLVDDDVRNIFALTSALEQKGLKVEIARDGFEALGKLDEVDDIDLVLMDVMMPGMDGLEATRRIRADSRFGKLPIIAITAKAMKDDQEQCRKAGTNDYLAKPIDLDRLFSLLRVWMPSAGRI